MDSPPLPKGFTRVHFQVWHMDSPPLPKGFTRVHLQVLGYGFSYYTPRRLHNCSYYCLNLNYVKFEIATIHTPNKTWNSQKHYYPLRRKDHHMDLIVFFFSMSMHVIVATFEVLISAPNSHSSHFLQESLILLVT